MTLANCDQKASRSLAAAPEFGECPTAKKISMCVVDEPDEQEAGILMQHRGVVLFEVSGLLVDEGKGSRKVDTQFDTEDRST